MNRTIAVLGTTIVISVGLLTILGLVSGVPLLNQVAGVFLQLAVVTMAVTVLIGILNLLAVHIRRVRQRQAGWGHSLVLVLAAVLVLVATLLERLGVFSGEPALTTILVEQVQVAAESALAGLLLFALVYAASRVLRKRVSGWGLLFIVTLLVMLVGVLPLAQVAPIVQLRAWLVNVPVSAGARGMLLGIALATVVTGIRVLIGQDHSYRE